MLSHHTTKSRQTKNMKDKSPIESLKARGFEDAQKTKDGHQVHVVMGNCFVHGDNARVDYQGPVCGAAAQKPAQEEAAMDLLRLLLGAAPQSVRLAPGSLQLGAKSTADIREAARCLHEKLLGETRQPSWRLIADRARMAAPNHSIAGEPPVSDSGAGKRRKSPIYREGENDLDREERCLKGVRKLSVGVEYKPWELPREVWRCLRKSGEGVLAIVSGTKSCCV